MRRFNPEKELYKIQHGNRNKVILGVIALLIILGISSSYALYQVRYSKRIIYTKVAPFSNYDLDLAIYVDGSKVEKLPGKNEGYYYESITCENDPSATAGWDYTNWKLGAISATVPNKCNLNFTTHPMTLIEQVKHVNKINNNMVVDDETQEHNLRYIGANPDNYIWFNCNDYDSLTQDTAKLKCEKWRIIGLFYDIDKSDETTEDLVKIIRDDKIADMTWDTSYPRGSNNWTRPADLQRGLNGPYLNNSDTGGWITQEGYTTGYNIKNESYKGITSVTKNMIEQVTWNIGGMPYSSYTTAKVSDYYSAERESSVPNGASSTWNGDIGLMYPSDYGYATGGGNSKDRSTCLAYQLFNWKESGYKEDCASNDWLLDSNISQWTLTPFSGNVAGVAGVGSDGIIGYVDYANYTLAARPSLYLKSNVKLVSGDGSNETPYIIIP